MSIPDQVEDKLFRDYALCCDVGVSALIV